MEISKINKRKLSDHKKQNSTELRRIERSFPVNRNFFRSCQSLPYRFTEAHSFFLSSQWLQESSFFVYELFYLQQDLLQLLVSLLQKPRAVTCDRSPVPLAGASPALCVHPEGVPSHYLRRESSPSSRSFSSSLCPFSRSPEPLPATGVQSLQQALLQLLVPILQDPQLLPAVGVQSLQQELLQLLVSILKESRAITRGRSPVPLAGSSPAPCVHPEGVPSHYLRRESSPCRGIFSSSLCPFSRSPEPLPATGVQSLQQEILQLLVSLLQKPRAVTCDRSPVPLAGASPAPCVHPEGVPSHYLRRESSPSIRSFSSSLSPSRRSSKPLPAAGVQSLQKEPLQLIVSILNEFRAVTCGRSPVPLARASPAPCVHPEGVPSCYLRQESSPTSRSFSSSLCPSCMSPEPLPAAGVQSLQQEFRQLDPCVHPAGVPSCYLRQESSSSSKSFSSSLCPS